MSDVVERLHALLVHTVSERRGIEPDAAPVTVAEIYQDLVPYRSVRAALGLEMNADYEHALLRLLSGEQNLARLEPPTAREQLRDELASPNPNVTLYRKFAGCDVWLGPPVAPPDWVTSQLVEEDPAPAWESESAAPEPGWSVADDEAELLLEETEEDDASVGTAPLRSDADQHPYLAAARCRFCDSALPHGRAIRYCPYCGADQALRPCAACGEVLEAGWGYCIACGTPAESSA
jgi:hypothetical protein